VRRQDWREQRDRGEVALDALMPLETEQEERWKYWVKQPPLVAQTSITSPLAPLHEVERGTGTSPLTPLHSMERGTGSVEEAQGNENVGSSTSPSPQVERGPGGEVALIPGYIYQLCRELRSQQTPAEEALWSVLRNRQLNDLKFRRQHPLGRYIADFYCAEKRLVVELDGAVHQKPEQQTYDQIRNEELEARDLTVLRISNSEVEENLEGVLAKILTGCNAPSADFTSPLAPLHSVERGTGTSPLAPLHSVERGTGMVGGQGEEKVFSSSSPSPLVERGPGGEVNSGAAKTSIRHLKLLDPACGSGHFLIIAFDLLFAFYQEEARHRGETWDDRDIVESILAHNLHGLDLDPRAVQIAAAALYLKAKALCPQAELSVLNLVAANLNLAALPEDDPALVELRQAVTASTGIPEELTNQIVQGLKGADAWGSLLKVDDAVDGAIASYEWQQWKQGELFASNSDSNSPLLPGRGAGGVDATAASRRVGGLLPGEDRPHPLTPSPKTGEGGQETVPHCDNNR
jgi:very-short-patch-repair endonuclease